MNRTNVWNQFKLYRAYDCSCDVEGSRVNEDE